MPPTRILLERDVEVPMGDGTVLRADVYRPEGEGRWPVLLQRTPYDKTQHALSWGALDPTKLAAAGYAVVLQDVRGRFASGGEFSPYVHEAADGAESIAWAAAQPWSSGAVGTYGVSYMGQSQWLAAQRRPPALAAMVTATAPNDAHSDLTYRGGALQLGVLAYWNVVAVAPHELVRRRRGSPELGAELAGLVDDIDALDARLRQLPLVPFAPLMRGGGLVPSFHDDVRDEVRGERHERMSSGRVDAIEAPVLQVAGWYDLCLQPDLDHFMALRAEGPGGAAGAAGAAGATGAAGAANARARRLSRIVIGPWAHGSFGGVAGELDFGLRASGLSLDLREDLTGLHRRWFDARLRGLATGIDEEPPVKLFVMGRKRWRYEDEWPLRRARAERWYVHGDGSLRRQPPGEAGGAKAFTLEPDDPVPTRGGALLMAATYARGPAEQALVEARPDVLVFSSAPLDEEYEATGRLRFVAYVAAETVDTDVVIKLCDVHPDGRSYNVADGVRRLRFRDSLEAPKLAKPGEVYRVEVDLWSTSHVFLRGHRLRVQVAASDFPRYDRCAGTGEGSATATRVVRQRNLLFCDAARASFLELPFVPG
ncbi:MAG: CocE/NonD family hydrolase [Polyangiaceae bacterium]|nr:CocE/NonD family hydrolase [Polyangiaceae bacterium]